MPAASRKDAHPDRPALKEKLDGFRDDLLRKQLLGGVAALLPSQACAVHAASAPSVHLLLDLMDQFEADYQAAKKQRCALDFQDLEQRCLRLLRSSEGGPSEIALLYQEQFDYVLVDEYQDVNHAQDAILALVSRRADATRSRNLFMVGDVKQSIYAFRQAAPEIFLEKYFGFPAVSNSDGSTARINLSRNFRSRPEILQTVNRLFEAMMTKASAGLDYDADAALVAGGDFSPEGAGHVELHVLEKSGEVANQEIGDPGNADLPIGNEDSLADARVAEREAFLVGRKILEMSGTFAFKDVVVLLRSMQGWADAFVSIFHRLGIPAFTDYGTGLLAAQEVRDILHFLTLLDNPLQDVSLAAVLRSPLEGWTETELLQVRQGEPTRFFHEAFRAAAETNPKAAEFINRIEQWRTRARRQSLADLLSDIYAETDYPTLVLGLSDGERRRANLLRLQEIAGRFDHFSRRGLVRFLRFVDQLREQEGDYGAASPFFEGMDAVRVMTVHKSKGLEFPVVFLPGMGKG
ncbi:TPA: helicase-exonuclease AddAB subunit AddA, partial [Candidatus Sumerlaeota bacterium]|nr:helicase-exonuclease AddAB subunit AddA [Candidatus Sumerlaeota bacterium]